MLLVFVCMACTVIFFRCVALTFVVVVCASAKDQGAACRSRFRAQSAGMFTSRMLHHTHSSDFVVPLFLNHACTVSRRWGTSRGCGHMLRRVPHVAMWPYAETQVYCSPPVPSHACLCQYPASMPQCRRKRSDEGAAPQVTKKSIPIQKMRSPKQKCTKCSR